MLSSYQKTQEKRLKIEKQLKMKSHIECGLQFCQYFHPKFQQPEAQQKTIHFLDEAIKLGEELGREIDVSYLRSMLSILYCEMMAQDDDIDHKNANSYYSKATAELEPVLQKYPEIALTYFLKSLCIIQKIIINNDFDELNNLHKYISEAIKKYTLSKNELSLSTLLYDEKYSGHVGLAFCNSTKTRKTLTKKLDFLIKELHTQNLNNEAATFSELLKVLLSQEEIEKKEQSSISPLKLAEQAIAYLNKDDIKKCKETLDLLENEFKIQPSKEINYKKELDTILRHFKRHVVDKKESKHFVAIAQLFAQFNKNINGNKLDISFFHEMLADHFLNAKKYQEALQEINLAIELNNDEDLIYTRADICKKLENEKSDKTDIEHVPKTSKTTSEDKNYLSLELISPRKSPEKKSINPSTEDQKLIAHKLKIEKLNAAREEKEKNRKEFQKQFIKDIPSRFQALIADTEQDLSEAKIKMGLLKESYNNITQKVSDQKSDGFINASKYKNEANKTYHFLKEHKKTINALHTRANNNTDYHELETILNEANKKSRQIKSNLIKIQNHISSLNTLLEKINHDQLQKKSNKIARKKEQREKKKIMAEKLLKRNNPKKIAENKKMTPKPTEKQKNKKHSADNKSLEFNKTLKIEFLSDKLSEEKKSSVAHIINQLEKKPTPIFASDKEADQKEKSISPNPENEEPTQLTQSIQPIQPIQPIPKAANKENDRSKKNKLQQIKTPTSYSEDQTKFLSSCIPIDTLKQLYIVNKKIKKTKGEKLVFTGSKIYKIGLGTTCLKDFKTAPLAESFSQIQSNDFDCFIDKLIQPVAHEDERKKTEEMINSFVFKAKSNEKKSCYSLKPIKPGKGYTNYSLQSHSQKIESELKIEKIDLTLREPGLARPSEDLIPLASLQGYFSNKPHPANEQYLSLYFGENQYFIIEDKKKILKNTIETMSYDFVLPNPEEKDSHLVTCVFARAFSFYFKMYNEGKPILMPGSQAKKLLDPKAKWAEYYFIKYIFTKNKSIPCFLEMNQLIRKNLFSKKELAPTIEALCRVLLVNKFYSLYKNIIKNSSDDVWLDNFFEKKLINKMAKNMTTLLQTFYTKEAQSFIPFEQTINILFSNHIEFMKDINEEQHQRWIEKLKENQGYDPSLFATKNQKLDQDNGISNKASSKTI